MARNGGNVLALQSLAAKIGLGAEEKVISKAAEYERRLQMKSTTSYNISDTGKVVICLDLAATSLGVEFDTKTSMKYSGLKPLLYCNSRKILENLLELNRGKLTVPLLCAQLHCDSVQELAQRALDLHCKTTKKHIDLNLPQYVCMAVYQACRINKVKVSKSKLIEKSRLKPGQWSKMEAEWTKMADLHFAVANKKKSRKPTKILNEDEPIEKMEIDANKKDDDDTEPQVEPYEEWKRRILAAAYAAIARQRDIKVIPENHCNQVTDKHVNDEDRMPIIKVTDLKHINDNIKPMTDIYKQVNDKHKFNTEVRKPNDCKQDTATKLNGVDNKVYKKNIRIMHSPNRNRNNNAFVDVEMDDKTGKPDSRSDKSNKQVGKLNSQNDKSNNHVDKSNKQFGKSNEQDYKSNKLDDKKDKIDNRYQKRVQISDDDLFCLSPRKSPKKKVQISDDDLFYLSPRKSPKKKVLILDDDLFCLSPRKTPRETPQKYKPYHSPVKTKGVRLLFPTN